MMPRLLSPFDRWLVDDEDHVAGVQRSDNHRPTLFRNIEPYYGAFYDMSDQTALADTATVMRFDTLGFANGVQIVDNTKIMVSRAGVYNLQFSAMFENPEASAYDVSVWLDLNGSNVAASNTDLTIPGKHGGVNGHAVAAWNFLLSLAPTDYVRLMWSTPFATVLISHQHVQTTPTRPDTPSVILTVNQVN